MNAETNSSPAWSANLLAMGGICSCSRIARAGEMQVGREFTSNIIASMGDDIDNVILELGEGLVRDEKERR
jgi:hypothetical protein